MQKSLNDLLEKNIEESNTLDTKSKKQVPDTWKDFKNIISNLVLKQNDEKIDEEFLDKYYDIIKKIPEEKLKKMSNIHIYAFLVEKDSKVYSDIPKDIRKWNILIWDAIIEALIREKNTITDVRKAIAVEDFSDMQGDLLVLLEEYLSIKNPLYISISNLRKTNPDFVLLLEKKNIIYIKEKKVSINKKFVLDFVNALKERDDFKNAKYDEEGQIIFDFLMRNIWLNPDNLWEAEMNIINIILVSIDREKLRYEIKEKIKKIDKGEEKNWNEEKKEKIDEELSDWVKFTRMSRFHTDSFFDLSTFGVLNSSWYYVYETKYWAINFTEEEAMGFNSNTWFQNFINFYNNLHKAWLWFFRSKKYRNNFKFLIKSKLGLKPDSWSWINENQTLKIFDLIGFALWVPEKERITILENWEEKKEYRRFLDFWEAISYFANIAITGKIKWKNYSSVWWAPVENYLDKKWYIYKETLQVHKWDNYNK